MSIYKIVTHQGYVTISATLIVSAILVLIISQSVLHSSMSVRSLIEVEQALKAQARGRACAEVVWQQTVTDVNYEGIQELEKLGGVCTITLLDTSDVRYTLIDIETTEGSIVSYTHFRSDMEEPNVMTTVWSVE